MDRKVKWLVGSEVIEWLGFGLKFDSGDKGNLKNFIEN